MAPTARELAPMVEACRALSRASCSGLERHELGDLLLRLAEGRADLEQALDELNDEQRGLRDENAKIHDAISSVHAGNSGAGAAWERQLFEMPRDVIGRWWEQAQPRSTTTLADAVSVASPSELGKQFVEQWQQLGQQVASRFGSSVFQASHDKPPADASQDSVKLERVVLDEVYRRIGRELAVSDPVGVREETDANYQKSLATEDQRAPVVVKEEKAPAIEDQKAPATEQPRQLSGSLQSLWSLPAQWQELGKRVADKLCGRTSEATTVVDEASGQQVLGKPLERVVLDQLYASISRRSLPGVQPELKEKAHELCAKTLSAQPSIASSLWAVTLHWQHFGAPDRADPGPGSPKLGFVSGGSVPDQVSLLDACEPLECVVLREVYRSVCERLPVEESSGQAHPLSSLAEEAAEGLPDSLSEDRPSESPRESGSDRSPSTLGRQFVDQWQQWGRRVNEQFTGYAAQGPFGWESLKQALGESDLEKKKKVKKAKKEKTLQVEEEAGIVFTRIVLKAQIKLGDGSVETLDMRTNEQCKEVAARFVRQHYLDSCLKKPLKAFLRNALNSATSLPVTLEVDLQDIEQFLAEQ